MRTDDGAPGQTRWETVERLDQPVPALLPTNARLSDQIRCAEDLALNRVPRQQVDAPRDPFDSPSAVGWIRGPGVFLKVLTNADAPPVLSSISVRSVLGAGERQEHVMSVGSVSLLLGLLAAIDSKAALSVLMAYGVWQVVKPR